MVRFVPVSDIRFVLASASPRRRQLLSLLGYPFEVLVSGVEEDDHQDAGPANYVLQTARNKARAVFGTLKPDPSGARLLVIAADTTVAQDDIILGKPASPAEAREMLLALRGRTHEVHTAMTVIDLGAAREESVVHTASVTMRHYNDAELEAYLDTGDPLDKAGAYAIQHPGFRPVERLSGCYLGVVGLPLCHLIPLLRKLNVPDRHDPAALVDSHRGMTHAP